MNEIVSTVEQTTELATIPQKRELTPAIWQMISEMAVVMHHSMLFGVSSKDQATAIMLKGYEMGMSITASFELIQVVQGKVALSPKGALAMLITHPDIKEIKINRLAPGGKFEGYECTMTRKSNGFTFTAKYTMDDAQKAGLVKPGSGWANYPENMCRWRAIGFCADVVAPDITAGLTGLMIMPEKYGVALDEAGNVIDAKAQPIDTQYQEEKKEFTTPVISLDSLVAHYGAEAIMTACEGKLPATQDEINSIAAKLAGE